MIKSVDGLVEVEGDAWELSADLTCAIRTLIHVIGKEEGEDTAKLLIAKAIEVGVMPEDEFNAEQEKAAKEFERGVQATFAKAMLFD